MHVTYCVLPFEHIPYQLLSEITLTSNYWLIMFSCNDGISDTPSPQILVTDMATGYNELCKLEFGDYVQKHEQHNNSMNPSVIGVLAP